MKRFFSLLLTIFFLFSCKENYIPRKIDTVSVQEIVKDSTSIRAIIALDDQKMIYAGSNADVGLTEDGGAHWKTISFRYQDTIFPHFRSIAKTTSSLFVLSIATPALLYKITNGEKNLVYTENHPNVFYDAMAFFDDKHGIAVGDPVENGCLSIITTHDGGNTWQKIPCSELPKTTEGEAFFAASNTNISIVKNTVWIATGGKETNVLKSKDMGKTWEKYVTPIIQGEASQGIYSIDFYDENNGIVIGGDYLHPNKNLANKAITKDGGKTWELVADGQNPNYKSCVQFVPNTQGKEVFAVGKTGISYSNDGGITWKDVSKQSFYTIQFVDKNTAWLAGHQKIGKLKLP